MNRLLQELRRRKVGRVVIAYAAAAFVVLQVSDIALPPLGVPDWVMAAIVVLTALGFPVAIALSWAFDVTRDGVVRTPSPAPASATPDGAHARGLQRPAAVLFVIIALASIVAGGIYASARYVPDPALDQDLVAIVPFRVSGDASLDYLREGMLDLFAASLTGEGGLRAADPRLVLSAVERIARRRDAELAADSAKLVARAVGAGRVLIGSVVGTPGAIIVTASLVRVTGTSRTIDATVRGPAEAITSLIDRITAELLSVDAGETEQRLATLTSTSLPALRAYLAGQAAYRRSRFADAAARFDEAIVHDSTFALAALMLNTVSGWGGTVRPNQGRSARLAWQFRDRLSNADRTFLEGRVGSDYPRPRSVAQRLADWERALAMLPDRPDALFLYGDLLFHEGAIGGRENAADAAVQAFDRTLAIDSSFTPALTHLLDAAIWTRDTTEARRLLALLAQRDTSHDAATYQYWSRISFFGDSSDIRALLAGIDTLPDADLSNLRAMFLFGDVDATVGRAAVEARLRRALTSEERNAALHGAYRFALSVGRPAEATRYAEQALRLPAVNEASWHARIVLDGLFADGDSALARRGAERIGALLADSSLTSAAERRDAACAAALWHATRNDVALATARARALGTDPAAVGLLAEACALTVRAVAAHAAGAADAAVLLQRADSIAALGPPPSGSPALRAINFTLARLYELRGSPADARRAARRHVYTAAGEYQMVTHYLEDGRLSERLGDRAAAITAYQRYLQIRSEPEPVLQPQVAAVQAALARLLGDTSR